MDDDKEIRDAIEIYLKNEGLCVFKAEDGIEALKKLDEHSVHLILLDIMMPHLDGMAATIKIRQEKNIPIILLSAKSLLEQALAENDEAIQQSTLTFRVKRPETPVYCTVDGQKLWRVFDNLISNILKYSLENTRVHISVIEDSEAQTRVVFKNVTKYELNENVDELFNRFKRGDTSRHTEGSGLGLAIAQSIVELHKGRLELEIDGDLFKATVMLKCERKSFETNTKST